MLLEAYNLCERVEELLKEQIAYQSRLDADIKRYDAIVVDLYHILEYASLDAVKLSKVTKELRETLGQRRRLKNAKSDIQSAITKLSLIDCNIIRDRSIETEKRNARYKRESIESYNRIFGED